MSKRVASCSTCVHPLSLRLSTSQEFGQEAEAPAIQQPASQPCLMLGGTAHQLPPRNSGPSQTPHQHLARGDGTLHQSHGRQTHNIDSLPSQPATAPAAANNGVWRMQGQQHESPEVANSCAASGGHMQCEAVQPGQQLMLPSSHQAGAAGQAGPGAHGGVGGTGGSGGSGPAHAAAGHQGQGGTVVGGAGPSGTAVSATAGSGGSHNDVVSGAVGPQETNPQILARMLEEVNKAGTVCVQLVTIPITCIVCNDLPSGSGHRRRERSWQGRLCRRHQRVADL